MSTTRRTFLTGSFALLSAPLAAEAQQAGNVPRIGFLRNGTPPKSFVDALRWGLRELGYVEGQNIAIEYELPDTADKLFDAAMRLVDRKVDLVVAAGTPPVAAARRATNAIPIVFVASIDPISPVSQSAVRALEAM